MTIDPSKKNDIYNGTEAEWRANRDFAEMPRKTLRDGTYMPRFGKHGKLKEPDAQYEWRKDSAVLLDLASDLIDMRVQELWRQSPVRKYEKSPFAADIEAFLADIDGAGTDIDTAMRDLTRRMHINGVDVLVDKGAQPYEPVSRADERGKPYIQMFSPLDRYHWSCDHAGKYHFVRYALGSAASTDEDGAGPEGEFYLTYTRDLWRLYQISGMGSGRHTELVGEGPHMMGKVPVVQCYWASSVHDNLPSVPISLMSKLSPISENMLNLTSQGQLDLLLCIAFFKAIGIPPDQAPKGIGVGSVVTIDAPDGDFAPVFTDVKHIVEKREWLTLLTLAQLRIGKVLGLAATIEGRAQSGVQVAMEASPLHSELMATAGNLERCESEIVRLAVSRIRGEPVAMADLGYSVEYNKRYTLQSPKDLIEQVSLLLGVNGIDELPKLAKLYFRKLIDAAIRPGTDEYEAAVKELDSLTLEGIPSELKLEDEDEDATVQDEDETV